MEAIVLHFFFFFFFWEKRTLLLAPSADAARETDRSRVPVVGSVRIGIPSVFRPITPVGTVSRSGRYDFSAPYRCRALLAGKMRC